MKLELNIDTPKIDPGKLLIAVLGLIAFIMVFNIGGFNQWAAGALTGWDADAKRMYEQQLEINKAYVDTAREIELSKIRRRCC